MPDFSKSKIYKLVSPKGLVYIGSTTKSTVARLSTHQSHYKAVKAGKRKYATTANLLFDEDFDGVQCHLLEEYPCETLQDLKTRERYYIESMECVNEHLPTRTRKEYRDQHRDTRIEKMKEYYQKNKDYLKQKVKEYRDANADVYKEYYEKNKEKICNRGKEYREAHKDKYKEYYAKYDAEHREKKKEWRQKPITCGCGMTMGRSSLQRHLRTASHKKWENEQ